MLINSLTYCVRLQIHNEEPETLKYVSVSYTYAKTLIMLYTSNGTIH
jgi:hypothetical protein